MEVKVHPGLRRGDGTTTGLAAAIAARQLVLKKQPPAPPSHMSMKARAARLDDNLKKNGQWLAEHRSHLDDHQGTFGSELGGFGVQARRQSDVQMTDLGQNDQDRESSDKWLQSWREEQQKLTVAKASDWVVSSGRTQLQNFGFSATSDCSPIRTSPPVESPQLLQRFRRRGPFPSVPGTPGGGHSIVEDSGFANSPGGRWAPTRRSPITEPVSALTLDMEARLRQQFLFGTEARPPAKVNTQASGDSGVSLTSGTGAP